MYSYGLRKKGEDKILKKWKRKPSWNTLQSSYYGAAADATKHSEEYEVVVFECNVVETIPVSELKEKSEIKMSKANEMLSVALQSVIDDLSTHLESLENSYRIQPSKGIKIIINSTKDEIEKYKRKLREIK